MRLNRRNFFVSTPESKPAVTKAVFLNAVGCRTRGWRLHRAQASYPSAGDGLRMKQGIEIGRRSRSLFSGGVLITDTRFDSAAQRTQSLMQDTEIQAIFEATFLIDGYATKADVLQRTEAGWNLYEVKSKTDVDQSLIEDVAYTAMVLQRAGVALETTCFLLVSKDFRLRMSAFDLFVEIDATLKVQEQVLEFQPLWEEIRETLVSPKAPESQLIFECRNCDFFKDCTGSNVSDHIFDLPRLHRSKFAQLSGMGIQSIHDVPDDFPLTDRQATVRQCVMSGETFSSVHLKKKLESVSWPAHYLDFETVMTAIPLYEGVAPYEQVVVQYSVHTCRMPGDILTHTEYLAEPSRDCREDLATLLLSVLHGKGSIVTYSGFEATIIKGLSRHCPSKADDLLSLLSRIVDLEKIIRENYYHQEFHGRTSIKTTLPILASDLSYDDLYIKDGDTAMAAFADMAIGELGSDSAQELRHALLKYCARDTMAMVRLHERLLQAVSLA